MRKSSKIGLLRAPLNEGFTLSSDNDVMHCSSEASGERREVAVHHFLRTPLSRVEFQGMMLLEGRRAATNPKPLQPIWDRAAI